MEAALRRLPGVIDAEDGYSREMTGIGDNNNNIVGAITTTTMARTTGASSPSSLLSYERVCGGKTGYAKTIRVKLDRESLKPRTLFD